MPAEPAAPLRVLHVTLRADFTGGPLYAHKLIRGLSCGEIENYVACPPDGPLTPEYATQVGADHLFPLPERAFSLAALRGLARYVRRHRIAIVHSHGKGAGLYARLVAAITPARAVHTFHGLHFRHYGRAAKLGYRVLERSLSAMSGAMVAVIESERRIAIEQGFAPPGKVVVIRTGLEAVPPLAHWPADAPVEVLHFSRFDIQKNFDGMLALAQAARDAGLAGRLRFVIVGDGPRRPEYEARTDADGTTGFFRFLGIVPDVGVVMERCRALVSTSRWEGLPVAPLEAGLAGLFLALSRIPGHEELALDSDGAILFDLADPRDHGDVVRRLAALAGRTAGAVDHRAKLMQAFSFDGMVRAHGDLYRRIARAG